MEFQGQDTSSADLILPTPPPTPPSAPPREEDLLRPSQQPLFGYPDPANETFEDWRRRLKNQLAHLDIEQDGDDGVGESGAEDLDGMDGGGEARYEDHVLRLFENMNFIYNCFFL